jgi:thioredoxin-related protein
MESANPITFQDRKSVAKQLYYRCSYADFKPGCDCSQLKIKFRLSTRTRLFLQNIQNLKAVQSDSAGFSPRDHEVAKSSLEQWYNVQKTGQFVLAAFTAETLYYLPNHFR